MNDKHVITLEVEDKPGVLTRISSLFSRRGFNIDSLTVGHTHRPGISRFTIVVRGDERILEQIRKQTQKLIHIISTDSLDLEGSVMREFAIVKLEYNDSTSLGINNMIDLYGARMLDSSNEIMIVEFSGSQEKIDRIFEELNEFHVIESIRTGKIGMKIGQ